jgi:hypothetical protein
MALGLEKERSTITSWILKRFLGERNRVPESEHRGQDGEKLTN